MPCVRLDFCVNREEVLVSGGCPALYWCSMDGVPNEILTSLHSSFSPSPPHIAVYLKSAREKYRNP